MGAGPRRAVKELVHGGGSRRRIRHRRHAQELATLGCAVGGPRDGDVRRRARPPPGSGTVRRRFKTAIVDGHRRPALIDLAHGEADRLEVSRDTAERHHTESHARRIFCNRPFDRIGLPVRIANRPIAHVIEEADLLVRPVNAQPESSPGRRLARRGANQSTEADRPAAKVLRRHGLHDGGEAVDGCARHDGPARAFGFVRSRHARTGQTGPKVAPRDQLRVRASQRGRRRQGPADFDARPQRAEKLRQHRLECLRIPSAAHLLHAMDGEAVPIEAGRRVAGVEVAHHTIDARKGCDIVDRLLGGLPRRGRSPHRSDQQEGNQWLSHRHLSRLSDPSSPWLKRFRQTGRTNLAMREQALSHDGCT